MPFLFLPRQSKENYVSNERSIDYTDIFDTVYDAGGDVLHTDRVQNLSMQIEKIDTADVHIVDYASSLYFNGLIGTNKTIYALQAGPDPTSQLNYPLHLHLYRPIEADNELVIVPSISSGAENTFTCAMLKHLSRFCRNK